MNKVKVLIEGYAKEINGGWLASSTTTLIQTDKLNILVDPGVNKELLLEKLASETLHVTDIDYVYMTHYHPDHILLTGLFENAKKLDGDTIFEKDLETPYTGNLPGTNIEVIKTPGHADEHTSLIIKTEDLGTVVIAADVFWWTDAEDQLIDRTSLINKVDPFTKDEKALKKSRKTVLDLADWIVPGHGKIFKAEE